MYQNLNEQFGSATRQFSDTAAHINQLALQNVETILGLQMATLEKNISATFDFCGDLVQVRDMDALKGVMPKGMQIARENIERTISTGQEVLGRTVKTNEAIGQIAKGQFETVSAQAKAEVEKVTNVATKTRRK